MCNPNFVNRLGFFKKKLSGFCSLTFPKRVAFLKKSANCFSRHFAVYGDVILLFRHFEPLLFSQYDAESGSEESRSSHAKKASKHAEEL